MSATVLSVSLTDPVDAVTNADSVTYTVTFSEAVTGVDPTDFQLATTGSVGTTLLQVTPESTTVYTVSISGITGNGNLGLNVLDNGSITDLTAPFTGAQYTIDNVAPSVTSIVRSNPASATTSATSVQFTVNFSENVTGVSDADFDVFTAGGVGFAAPIVVNQVSGSQYTVTVNGITGTGTLGLDLDDDNSIRDAGGNALVNAANPATFQPQRTFGTDVQPSSIAAATLDGDGNVDLAVANFGGFGNAALSVLLGNGDGMFKPQQTFAAGGNQYSVGAGDVDGDGEDDLVVANKADDTVSVLLGNGDGTFEDPQTFATGAAPNWVSLGDVDGDGFVDMAVANFNSDSIGVLLGNGDGTFQAQQTFATGTGGGLPKSVVIADVDGDRSPDLVVAVHGSNAVGVLLGNGDGTFEGQQTLAAGVRLYSATAADVDGDGNLDLITSNYGEYTVSVLLGNGDGTFEAQRTFAAANPIAVSVGDVNGDGRADLVAANHMTGSVSVHLGNGDGNFQDAGTFAVGTAPIFIHVGDLNGDSRADLAVPNFEGASVSVLVNAGSGDFTGERYTITAAVNNVPVAQASSVTTNEDIAKTFAVADFLFTDVESNPLASITVSNLTLAAGDTLTVDQGAGAVAVTNGMTITAAQIPTLTYTPADHANGTGRTTFDFKVNDAGNGTVAATMTINVTALNDVPVAQASSVTTNTGIARAFAVGDFLFTDVESNPLASITVSNLTLAAGDTLTVDQGAGAVAVTNGMTITAAQIPTLT